MPEKKIKVEVCLGTTCFILGSSELQHLDRYMPDDIREHIEVVGRPCMKYCRDNNFAGAPFVRINGSKVIARATLENVQEALEDILYPREVKHADYQ